MGKRIAVEGDHVLSPPAGQGRGAEAGPRGILPPTPDQPQAEGRAQSRQKRNSEPVYCGLIHFVLTIPHGIKTLRESGCGTPGNFC